MKPERRIAHLDMDAFFASVELLSYPELKGQPVVVGGRSTEQPTLDATGMRRFTRLSDYVGRGVITTSTYEARALGVFSGMGLMKSALLAPEAILLPANFEAYKHYSRLFKSAVSSIAPLVEDRGIDEIYIDFADLDEDTERLALRIKKAVSDATGLSCSIGVSPNKLLSKICSDLDKPDGVTLLNANELSTRIWPLPAKKINGIGPKANEKLAALGIYTIGDLANTLPELLVAHFGRATGQWLYQAAHGVDDRPVVTSSEPKSLSRETTFERDLHAKQDRTRLSAIFTDLCNRLADDLLRKGYATKTIGIKIKYADFQVITRDLTLPVAIDEGAAIRQAATECLRRVPLDQRIRLLGVRAGSLSPRAESIQETRHTQSDLPF
jgi:DNA polymerase IV